MVTRSGSATSPAPAARRPPHLVDRAADYAALRAQGVAPAAIARRRRRSRGYVSIVLRLGEALRGLPEAELAALRHPRITYKLAQRVVREGVSAAEVRRQLRYALGGFSTHNVDGRRRRGRAGGEGPAPSRPAAPPWGWDAVAFAADPLAYASAHVAALARLHAAVEAAAGRTLAHAQPAGLEGAVSLRSLQRLLAHGAAGRAAAGPAAAREALRVLAHVRRTLDDLRRDVEGFRPGSGGTAPPRSDAPPEPGGATPADDPELQAALDRDLAD